MNYPDRQTSILAAELKNDYGFTIYEAFDIATKMIQNQLIARANVLDHVTTDKSGIEYIGIQIAGLCSKIDMLDDSIMELNNKEE
jgi:hypothetical protein